MQTDVFMMVLASGAVHACWNFVAKKNAANLAVSWLAQFVAILVLLGVALSRGTIHAPDLRAWVLITGAGLLQAAYFLLLTKAYQTGEVSVVYPVARGLGVAGASVAGFFAFRETPTLIACLGCFTVASGTALIGFGAVRQGPHAWRVLGYAVLIGLNLSCGSFIDKSAAMALDPPFYLGLVYICSSLASAPFFLAAKRRATVVFALQRQRLATLVIGTGASLGYLIVLFALRRGPLGATAAVREISVVFGAAAGIFLLKEQANATKIAGIITIVVGVALVRLS